MTAFFERLSPTAFRATSMTEGAWDPEQMHVAPGMALLVHAIEADRDARRDDRPGVTRVSVDILGPAPVAEVEVDVRVRRAGRTIELVEAALRHDDRDVLLARAWLQQEYDTSAIAGSPLPSIPGPDELEADDAAAGWSGAFAHSLHLRRRELEPGHGQFWLRSDTPLLEDEATSPTANAFRVIDVANGMSPRVPPTVASYPNLDLTVHLFRRPRDGWIGFDKTASFGARGVGLTRSTLYDADGPLGSAEQVLTVRMR